jgi:uncharacterized protein (TIGR03437 family)
MYKLLANALTYCAFLFTAGSCLAQTYTIATAAGGANPYYYAGTGDGGPATSAGLANPAYDVATDGAGNVYVIAGKLIRKFTPGGTISTYAGGGGDLGESVPATQAALEPTAIVTDSSGNLLIADTAFGFYRIRKVDKSGVITTIAGEGQCCDPGDGGPAFSAYIAIPYGLAVDAVGNLYVAQSNAQHNLIRKIAASNGSITTVAGGGAPGTLGDGGSATKASLSRPTGIAVDSAGNLYIAEAGANRVRKVAPDGTIITLAGTGSASSSGDGDQATKAAINTPWHVAVDAGGTVYIAEMNGARIRAVSALGVITTIAGAGTVGSGGDNGPATAATIDHPSGIAWAATGEIYFTQNGSGIARTRVLTPLLPPPAISVNGVGPLYSTATTIQPGSWISIYGTNLAAGTATWKGDFPTSLGGTSVTIDSKPAYLWFVGPNQINAQVPDDTVTGQVTVTVTTSGGTASSTVTLGPYGPSFCMFNAKYPAAIVIVDGAGNSGLGYDYIGPPGAFSFPTRPVKSRETLILFGVGFGPTNPPVLAGKLFTGSAPSASPPVITIGGIRVTVSFAGIVQAGLFQFNVVVPPAASGDQSMQAAIGGVTTSDKIVIAVE